MRRVLLNSPGEFVIEQTQPPAAQKGEALIRVRRVGVCGSDFHAFMGQHPAYTYPRVIGHELAGEIIEVEANELGIHPGDRCAIEPYMSCGSCGPCRKGRANCCENLRLYGVHVDGGMQGFLPVRVDLLHRSNTVSLDQLALVETLGIGAHAVRRSGLAQGETALVIGAGPIGLAVIEFAKAAGAKVQVVECNPWRLAFVSKLGVEALEERATQVADVVFDATGSADSMEESLKCTAPGGRLVFVGLTKGHVRLDDALLHKREITVVASRNSCGQFPRIIRMLEEKKIDVTSWITHRLSLSQVPSTFKDLSGQPRLLKAVVELDDADA